MFHFLKEIFPIHLQPIWKVGLLTCWITVLGQTLFNIKRKIFICLFTDSLFHILYFVFSCYFSHIATESFPVSFWHRVHDRYILVCDGWKYLDNLIILFWKKNPQNFEVISLLYYFSSGVAIFEVILSHYWERFIVILEFL